MRRVIFPALLIAMLTAACGGRAPLASGRSIQPSIPNENSAAQDIQDAVANAAPNGTTLAASSNERPSQAAPKMDFPTKEGPHPSNTMPLAVKVNRKCARVGDRMEATATTLKESQVVFATAYSNNQMVPDFSYTPKDANKTGTVVWTWVIRPEVTEGPAYLSVVASNSGRGASYDYPFTIARTC